MSDVSREAWLKAVGDTYGPLTDDPTAITAEEMAALCDISPSTARIKLVKMEQRGEVERVSKWIVDRGQRRLRVPAFRLITKPTKKVQSSKAR